MSHNDYVIFNGSNDVNQQTSPSSPPPPPPPLRTPPSFPAREDCWTEEATHTLIEAWGSHYLELNRGNLRQKHWQQVADSVNSLHAHTKKQYRTDIQCKNRIDTLKKRYKIEKSQTLQSNARYLSTWPFFNALDHLVADSFLKNNNLSVSPPSPQLVVSVGTHRPMWKFPPPPSAVPVGPRSKRPVSEEALSRRNFSAMAAAAARATDEEDDDDDDDDDDEGSDISGSVIGTGGRGCRRESKEDLGVAEGYKKLAEAIGRFADVYQRVEESKQRQMVELEKQRMQFTKDLEIQRMKLFMESQLHLEKIKRAKMNSPNDGYA